MIIVLFCNIISLKIHSIFNIKTINDKYLFINGECSSIVFFHHELGSYENIHQLQKYLHWKLMTINEKYVRFSFKYYALYKNKIFVLSIFEFKCAHLVFFKSRIYEFINF
jgi:hypothetical protein